MQRNKILSNLIEELKSDLETMRNEINAMNSSTKNRERELEKSIATLHNDIKTKMRKYLC